MDKIIKISKLAKLLVLAAGTIQASIFLYFAFVNASPTLTKQSFGDNSVNLSAIHEKWLSYAQLLENAGINSFWILGSFDFVVQIVIFIFLFKLFKLYEKGIIFSTQNCRYLQFIGTTMLAYGLAMIFLPSLTSAFINTFFSYPKIEINYYLGSNEISQLIWSSVILVISWIMKEACLMKEEQGLVI